MAFEGTETMADAIDRALGSVSKRKWAVVMQMDQLDRGEKTIFT
ncbi:hypothetical protein ARMA_0566 [Ardenticatena maritima]|uniref:Uncharacterized protein n=1 Tax=Ardenticatena maritima TaxID=872965 RepID=A0A0M8K5I6_9CHLR|nr:hypothetical protein ARMA_0566 [Ardenticatena maritima]